MALAVDVQFTWYLRVVGGFRMYGPRLLRSLFNFSPKSDANIFEWIGTLEGPPGSVYEKLTFKITLSFPPTYPYTPPNVRYAP